MFDLLLLGVIAVTLILSVLLISAIDKLRGRA
jgi:hypothetical protein